jgi:hypothetical protein
MPVLAQTLHGYDHGHRLLASGGDLDSRELALLERLSDLSGYLPRETSFERYHTGFRCGRYYAFACTWPDLSGTRAGTVLTHTLLLPIEEACALDDLWALSPLHRRPIAAADRDAFQAPLSLPTLPPTPEEPPLPLAQKQALVVLLFGSRERPILWVEESPPSGAVRFLWSLLAPEQRETFAFCTFALQLRSVEGRLFDFLGLPPTARGSFLERAGNEAWWDTGRFLHPHLADLLQQPWVQDIARNGSIAVQRLYAWCRSHNLDLPEAQLPILWRLLELEPAASQRLAAARSWADLFERLWPTVDPLHPCATRALEQILSRLPEASFEQRPLFELTDFLKRPLTRRRFELDEGFAFQVEAFRTRELSARFERAPEPTLEGLPELLEASGPRWRQESTESLQRIVASTSDAAVRLSPPLLLAAARTDQLSLARVALAPLPPGERLRAFEVSMAHPGSANLQDALVSLASTIAEHERDAELLFTTQSRRGTGIALLSAARMLVALGEKHPESVLETLLARTDPSSRLEWALREPAPPLARLAAITGARAARELNLSLEEVVSRCGNATLPNGPRMLLAFAESLPSTEALTPALHAAPRFARNLLVQVLEEPWDGRTEQLTRIAYEVVPPEILLTHEVLHALLRVRDRPRLRDPMRRIGPRWVRAVCEAEFSVGVLANWLDIPSFRQWLRDASRSQLVFTTPPESQDLCLSRLSQVLLNWGRESREAHDKGWLGSLLDVLLRESSARQLDQASEHLAALLRSLLGSAEGAHLAAQTIASISRTRINSGWRLVEVVFPSLYASLLREEPSLIRILASVMTGKDWDKAKPLRQWLIEAYVSLGWPPGSLLLCLNGDTTLFRRLVPHAARLPGGLRFLQSLPFALEAEPALVPVWHRVIAEALADPWRPVDYE